MANFVVTLIYTMAAINNNTPHDDKHYLKLLRTYRLIVYMVLSALLVLVIGVVLIWLFDKAGSFMSRGWQIFIIIVFAILVAGLQLPDYIMDIRKIEKCDSAPLQEEKPKPYAAALDHARKEGLVDENNQLQVSRAEFVRFCRDHKYFSPCGRESWKVIEGILKGPGGKTVTAEQLAQTYQDIQLREGV